MAGVTDFKNPVFLIPEGDILDLRIEVYELERETEHNFVVKFRNGTKQLPKHKHRKKDLCAPPKVYRTWEEAFAAWERMYNKERRMAENRLKRLVELQGPTQHKIPYDPSPSSASVATKGS